jgi:hypothetical protein
MNEKGIDEKLLHSIHVKCIDVFEHRFKPTMAVRVRREVTHTDVVFNLILAKSMKTARAISVLTEKGYGEDGVCLSRSLFENFVHLAYMAKEETPHRAMLFLKHGELEYLKSIEGLPGNPTSNATRIAELENIFLEESTRIREKHPEIKHKKPTWSTMSLKQLSGIVGEDSQYKKLYSFMSQYSHPHAEGLRGYAFESEFSDLPGPSMVEETLVFSISFLIQTLTLINNYYGYGLEIYLEDLNMAHHRALNEASDD